jgi:SAM-dependent methyltransferase/uncharacterized protein YbaR (Trm112 family)
MATPPAPSPVPGVDRGARLPDQMLGILVCPRDKQPLTEETSDLICAQGHRYAVIEGIPILLVSEAEQTHIEGTRALSLAESRDVASLPQFHVAPGEIDPFVQNAIGATNGSFYQHLVGKLKEYPIPRLRLPAGNNSLFLEVGCNWGRWCLAAAASGYRSVGIDPSLKAIRAANRVARQLGVEATYVVGDSRFLPFRDGFFDQVFSYSVLQHLSKLNARDSLGEIRRVLRAGGNALVQMPNVFGVRCLYHQVRLRFREPRDFDVRYWKPAELLEAFTNGIGPSELSVDGYFSLNVQASDLRFLPAKYRALVRTSEALRKLSHYVPPLVKVADSLYVSSLRAE